MSSESPSQSSSEIPADVPTVLVHEACGEPLDQAFVCWHCDETFTQSAIASRPGNTVTH